MKFTIVLAAFTAFSMAAPAEDEESGAVAKGDFSASGNEQQFSLLNTSEDGELDAQAYCGGFTPAGCRYACGVVGTACWMCTSTTCNCNNWVC